MILILGGGLSGSLLAYRLAQLDHPPDFLLIEGEPKQCENKTWSFHESDLNPMTLSWIRPLISRSWSHQEVRFRNYQRVFSNPYHSINSLKFSELIQKTLGSRLLLNDPVISISSNRVRLRSGRVIQSQVTFDSRGFEDSSYSICGYQKFVGIDLKLDQPHGLKHPVIMDSDCEQKEGYRFFYLLPWSTDSLLIEDTRYSVNSVLNLEEFRIEIKNYCKRANWKIIKELRTETGVLPIPLKYSQLNLNPFGVIPIGVRGGYFHLTTGYSLPQAVEVAETVACEYQRNPDLVASDVRACLDPLQSKIRKQSHFFGLLNKMLFLAAEPSSRWKIFERFYQLPENLIFRFYQGDLKMSDKARILMGKPPVPVFSALASILNLKNQKIHQGGDDREKRFS